MFLLCCVVLKQPTPLDWIVCPSVSYEVFVLPSDIQISHISAKQSVTLLHRSVHLPPETELKN